MNLAIILVATSWISLMSQTVTVRDGDGNIVQEATRTARLYESWWAVARRGPAMKSHGRAVSLHLGVCFIITFAVWYVALNGKKRAASVGRREDAPESSREETPHADA